MNTNTVYLIDDDPLNLEQLVNRHNLFLECGFEIAGAETDPRKALDAIRAIRPDAVFSDLKMPLMSGTGLWEELRRDEKPPVFVIISAYSEADDIRKIFKTQGFDYLVKPVSNEELTELLIEVSKRINKTPPVLDTETGSDELNGILAFIGEYPAMPHTIESAAKRCGLAPRAVSRLFSKHLNTTFAAYLTGVRMEKAEELLLSTDLRVKQIAAQCGFPDQIYFTRVFKREHGGTPPTDFRGGKMNASKTPSKPVPMSQNRKLRRRFTISAAVFVAVLLGLWFIYQQILFAHIRRTASETIALTESHLLTVLDDEFSGMKQTAGLIAGNERVQMFLTERDNLRRYEQAAVVGSIIQNAAYPDLSGDSILTVSADGSPHQFLGSVSSGAQGIIKQKVMQNAGTLYTVLELDNGEFFCLSNPVYRRVGGESVPVGYVVALSNLTKVRRTLTRLDTPTGIDTAVILGDTILFSSNPGLDGQGVEKMDSLYGSVTTARVTGSDLYAAAAITKEALHYEERVFYAVSAAAFVLLVMMVAAMFRWLSARMVSPMLQNAEDMQMGLLRLQISSHFVFNTISAIKGLSEKGENEKAALAAENLAGMLKNLHETGEENNVFDQIQNMNRYIAIMNIRHGGKFVSDVDADDRLGDYKMLGQILQPLAENALTHGLLTKTGECRLTVYGRMDAGCLVFEVSDNGVGMEGAQMKAMQDMIDRADEWDYAEYLLKGVALLNIQKRIRAKYGSGYGLALKGGPGAGMTVTVRLPLIREVKGGGGKRGKVTAAKQAR